MIILKKKLLVQNKLLEILLLLPNWNFKNSKIDAQTDYRFLEEILVCVKYVFGTQTIYVHYDYSFW